MIQKILVLFAIMSVVNVEIASQIIWDNAVIYEISETGFRSVSGGNDAVYLHNPETEEVFLISEGETSLLYSNMHGTLGTGGILFYFSYPDAGIINLIDTSLVYYCDNGISNCAAVKGDTIVHHNFYGDWLKVGTADSLELQDLQGVTKGFVIMDGYIYDYMTSSGHTNIFKFNSEGSLEELTVAEGSISYVTFLDKIRLKRHNIDGNIGIYIDLGDGEWQQIDDSYFGEKEYHRFALSYYDGDKLCITGVNYDTGDVLQIYTEQTFSSVEKVVNSRFILQPNPTSDKIVINSPEIIKRISVFDISGKLIIETHESEIDLSIQNVGTYILKIETDNGIFVEKVVKE